jgi:hypothetical protein
MPVKKQQRIERLILCRCRDFGNVILDRNTAIKFRSRKNDCRVCEVREKCLRKPDTSEVRQVCFIQGRATGISETFTEKMRQKNRFYKRQAHLQQKTRDSGASLCPYTVDIETG